MTGPAKSSLVVYYEPPGKDPQQWEMDRASWTLGESKLVERIYGKTRPEFFSDVAEGSDTARLLLTWIIRRRTEPDLLLEELDDLLASFLVIGVTGGDEDEAEDEDPQPDGVNDPKDTQSGSSDEPSVTGSESIAKPPGLRTA
jgi:hypothetical protein